MSTRWSINVSPGERVVRIVVGAVAALTGVVLLTDATTTLAVVLEIVLMVTGLDLVVTGATGHCPLYAALGHAPASQKGKTP